MQKNVLHLFLPIGSCQCRRAKPEEWESLVCRASGSMISAFSYRVTMLSLSFPDHPKEFLSRWCRLKLSKHFSCPLCGSSLPHVDFLGGCYGRWLCLCLEAGDLFRGWFCTLGNWFWGLLPTRADLLERFKHESLLYALCELWVEFIKHLFLSAPVLNRMIFVTIDNPISLQYD